MKGRIRVLLIVVVVMLGSIPVMRSQEGGQNTDMEKVPSCFGLENLPLVGGVFSSIAEHVSGVPALGGFFTKERIKPYLNTSLSADERAGDLLERMTLEEKVRMLHGVTDMGATGYIEGNDRLGIPPLMMEDGPVGVRRGKATDFPASIGMAAAWDPALLDTAGRDIGDETRSKGRGVLLAPCMNIVRVPMNGRTFESYGEDPFLTSRMAVSYVRGVQSNGVIATPKHYAANNQEQDRMNVSADVGELTLHEIYFPAFRASVVEAGALSVMPAYNRLNGGYCTENEYLMRELKGEWGFEGFTVSDWGATHSTVEAALAGLDVEMPGSDYFGDELLNAVKEGKVSEDVIDDKVFRVLRAMLVSGLFDRPATTKDIDYEAHGEDALRIAEDGMVLLKNEGILPLDPRAAGSVAVIGAAAKNPRYFGGGSASTDPVYTVSPYDALSRVFSGIIYAEGTELTDITPFSAECFTPSVGEGPGLYAQYYNNMNLSGEPALKRVDENVYFDWRQDSPGPGVNSDNFSVRWTGYLKVPESMEYEIRAITDDGMRVWIGGVKVIDEWKDQGAFEYTAKVRLEGNRAYEIRIEYYDHTGGAVAKFGRTMTMDERIPLMDEAKRAARGANVVLLFVQDDQTEGRDHDLSLPYGQNELIKQIAEANPNTVVILNTGGPVLMGDWIDKVPAVLEAWYGGQEMGNAVTNILIGRVNPSGRLPVTFPAKVEDIPAFCYVSNPEEGYPGVNGRVKYAEGVYVGYRHYDARNIAPQFPFGYGLSYTTFECSDFRTSVNGTGYGSVSIAVRNSGGVEGKAVVQLYKRSPGMDYKELIGFEKVSLMPGETKELVFAITPELLADYDESLDLVMSPGTYDLVVGSSSRDVLCAGSAEIMVRRVIEEHLSHEA